MNFTDKQKRVICLVIAVAMFVPIAIAAVGTFMGM